MSETESEAVVRLVRAAIQAHRDLHVIYGKVEQVMALHQPFPCENARCLGDGQHCVTCADDNGHALPWPCPTALALDATHDQEGS